MASSEDRRKTMRQRVASAVSGGELEDTPFNRINLFFRYLAEYQSEFFDGFLNNHLKLVSAGVSPTDPNAAYSVFEFTVPRALCNAGGNLHGGAVATIFDITTSMTIAPASREGFWDTGHVSRTLNCTYIRPAPEGTVLLVESEVLHLGKTMAQLKAVMRRKEDGAICYTCEHGKVKVDFKPKM